MTSPTDFLLPENAPARQRLATLQQLIVIAPCCRLAELLAEHKAIAAVLVPRLPRTRRA